MLIVLELTVSSVTGSLNTTPIRSRLGASVAPMPGLLRTFGERYPEIRIHLHEEHLQGLVDGLRDGRFDCALTYDLGLGPDLEFQELGEVPLHSKIRVGGDTGSPVALGEATDPEAAMFHQLATTVMERIQSLGPAAGPSMTVED